MKATEDIRAKVPVPDEAAEELCGVLDGAPLSEPGIFYQGDHVHLLASTWDSEADERCFDVVLSAMSPAGQRYSLENLVLYARGLAAEEKLLQVGQLLRTGDLVLKRLRREASYTFHCPALGGIGYPTLTPAIPKADGTGAGVAGRDIFAGESYTLAAKGATPGPPVQGGPEKSPQPQDFPPVRGATLHASIQEETGGVLVRLGTAYKCLAGKSVWFALAEKDSGRLLDEQTLTLRKSPAARYWEGKHLIRELSAEGPVALVFQVVSEKKR